MSQVISTSRRWTTADLEALEYDEWNRYEIIDGELFVTRSPHVGHQRTILNISSLLLNWSRISKLGEPIINPGVIFSDADNVIPDVVWVSKEKLTKIIDEKGHFTAAPELVIEVLSAGSGNERRDQEAKLKLYAAQGVQEYWIVKWRSPQVEIYRQENLQLNLVVTLFPVDTINSPLLPGFECQVADFFQ
jgi:Uma2 family endonuclease